MTRPKAHKLPLSTQRSIGAAKQKHPHLSYVRLAEQFNCTYDQARAAHQRYQAGKLKDGRGRWAPPGGPQMVTESGDAMGTFVALIDRAITGLYHDQSLTTVEQVQMIEKMGHTLKLAQAIQLQGHLKNVDAAIFSRAIRRYEPEATDDDILRIYHELLVS